MLSLYCLWSQECLSPRLGKYCIIAAPAREKLRTVVAMTARRNGLGPVVLFATACWLVDVWTASPTGKLPRDLALAVADEEG